ncbi:MAG: DUF2293 domain-containing protein [Desulfobacterales bacterium]
MAKQEDLRVFFSSRDSRCDECQEKLGSGELIALTDKRKVLCLSCADLDYLVYLSAGDAALTLRARKNSRLSAVVLKWSKARKRNERQGVLVEEAALKLAEQECLADEEVRALRRVREAERRKKQDREYIRQFSDAILDLYPKCPARTAKSIAEHACLKYSGRVGRSAAAKSFDVSAVRLAVVAHVRHTETEYDELLMSGWDRYDARQRIADQVDSVLSKWQETNVRHAQKENSEG